VTGGTYLVLRQGKVLADWSETRQKPLRATWVAKALH
jgi:hypothetical protein